MIEKVARQCILARKDYIPGKPIEEVQQELGIMDIIKISPLNNPSSSLPDGFVIRYNDNYEDETDTKEGEGRNGEEVLCRDPIGANLPDEERCGLY